MDQSHSRKPLAEPDRCNTHVATIVCPNGCGVLGREGSDGFAGKGDSDGISSARGCSESEYVTLSAPLRQHAISNESSSGKVELIPSPGRHNSVPMTGPRDREIRKLPLGKSYRAITLKTRDGNLVRALHLAGNSRRPDVLFAEEFEYHALFSFVQSEIARGEERESPKFITTGGFYLRAQLDAFREQNIAGPVVVLPWRSPRSRAEKIKFGMNIRHEFTHARGGGEFAARVAEWQYLRRNGILVGDLKPFQIIRELERLHSQGVYSEEQLHEAYDEFRACATPIECSELLADLTRRARWKSLVYRIRAIFNQNGGTDGSPESRYLERLAQKESKALKKAG